MRRLRNFPDAEELLELYAQPYDHTRWADHVERVGWTLKKFNKFLRSDDRRISFVFDPACGDGAILRGIDDQLRKEYGDIVHAPHLDVIGPLEDTIPSCGVRDDGTGDSLIVLTEIIEHVEDPERILRLSRDWFDWILLTTPINEVQEVHNNPQHIWAWSCDEMRELLSRCGWTVYDSDVMESWFYDYQLWICM